MKKRTAIQLLATCALLTLVVLPSAALATSHRLEDITNLTRIGTETGLGGQQTDIRITIAKLIRVAMGLLGIIAVVIVLYGGFLWMTAAGNEEKVTKAKEVLTAGVIGLIIIVSAFALAQFVIQSLQTAITP